MESRNISFLSVACEKLHHGAHQFSFVIIRYHFGHPPCVLLFHPLHFQLLPPRACWLTLYLLNQLAEQNGAPLWETDTPRNRPILYNMNANYGRQENAAIDPIISHTYSFHISSRISFCYILIFPFTVIGQCSCREKQLIPASLANHACLHCFAANVFSSYICAFEFFATFRRHTLNLSTPTGKYPLRNVSTASTDCKT
jgi:hypothetical protein